MGKHSPFKFFFIHPSSLKAGKMKEERIPYEVEGDRQPAGEPILQKGIEGDAVCCGVGERKNRVEDDKESNLDRLMVVTRQFGFVQSLCSVND